MQYQKFYLTETVHNVACAWIFQPDGQLRQNVRAMPKGVVRIIAGAEQCHVIIDIKRPYYRPLSASSA